MMHTGAGGGNAPPSFLMFCQGKVFSEFNQRD
jgi:hypothetical protein